MLNLRSNRTPWSNFPKGHPSSHYSSPNTLNFRVLSNPSNSSLHRHLLIYLAYQSYYTLLMSRTLFMFMTMMKFWKIFQTSRSYYVSFFWKINQKKIKTNFFLLLVAHHIHGAPLVSLNFFASRSWKPRNFFSVRFLRILKMFNGVPPVKFGCNFSSRWFFI